MGTVGYRNKAEFLETRIGHRRVMTLGFVKEFSVLLAFVASIALVSPVAGQVSTIDTARSKLLVHVSKSGVFSGFADNHEVEATIAEGTIDESGPRLTLSVDSRRMKVLDPQLSSDKRQQVQERMLGPEVLDSIRFPEIRFESTRVEQDRGGKVRVDGKLSLHGVTRPISILAQTENGRYSGRFSLKQRDFGIAPVSIAGGTVKVKDELMIEFDIHVAPGASNSQLLPHSASKLVAFPSHVLTTVRRENVMNRIMVGTAAALVMSLAMFAQQSGQDSGVPNKQEPTKERQAESPTQQPEMNAPRGQQETRPKHQPEANPPKNERQEVPNARNEQQKPTHEQNGTSTQRGTGRPAGKSAHIPDPQFRANFGRQHSFTVNRVITTTTIVPNQTQFVFAGFTLYFPRSLASRVALHRRVFHR